MLPGPPTLFQAHPQPSRSRPLTTCRPCGSAVTGAAVGARGADPPHARGADASRPSSPATGSPRRTGTVTMCRSDDDPETIANFVGQGHPRHRGPIVDDDGVEVPRGEPGEVVTRGYHVMQGYFDDPAADGGGHRRRRLAAHRRHRHHGRAGLHPHHRSQEGHVHRRRLQRLPRRDRGHAAAPPGGGPGRRGRRARRPDGRGRHGLRRAPPGTERRPGSSSSPGLAKRWPTTRCPVSCRGRRRSSRSTPAARSSSTSCASRRHAEACRPPAVTIRLPT